MKKKLRRTFYSVAAIFFIGVCWVFRPYESTEDSEVIPELRNLGRDLEVEVAYFLDGGSVGVIIRDEFGHEVKLCLPAPGRMNDEEYQRLFIGANHFDEEGAVEIPSPEQSIVRLLQIMRQSPQRNKDRDIAVAEVSGRWRDYATAFFRRIKDDF